MKTLIECKNEIAAKYGYSTWRDVDLYPESENAKTPEPPYFKERLHDEAAELYASIQNAELKKENEHYRGLHDSLHIQISGTINELKASKEENTRLREALKGLIGMAEDGYALHVRNGSHQEFLSEDREALFNAKEALNPQKP